MKQNLSAGMDRDLKGDLSHEAVARILEDHGDEDVQQPIRHFLSECYSLYHRTNALLLITGVGAELKQTYKAFYLILYLFALM